MSGNSAKNEMDTKGITVKKEEDIVEWYSQVVIKSKLADYSPVKGCMIIRPNGYAIWESIQKIFNKLIEEMNVKNAYFPLFIPESFFKKEAEHAEGFSPEVAWIERKNDQQERLAIRPTSETIMYDAYSRWIRSWRDLPLKINQWANVVRWEVSDVKLFLRSREFLWQEGHCAYATKEECKEETVKYLKLYEKFLADYLALPSFVGKKTESEKFAGAIDTYAVECFMPDGKSLQSGTSHFLGQLFSKAFNIKFRTKEDNDDYVWQNSWGISTRLIGAMIMLHADNKGMILPPRIANHKLVIIPLVFKGKEYVLEKAKELKSLLKEFNPILDDDLNYSPGWKFNQYELEGIPLRLEIGPRDIENNSVILVRRDTGEKIIVKITELKEKISLLLDDIHNNLFKKALEVQNSLIKEANNFDEFKELINNKKIGFVYHCGSRDCELRIKEETAATPRVIPFDTNNDGFCFACGKKAAYKLFYGRSY